jgi:hypothetical protein
MAGNRTESFADKRARAMALVLLTGRPDLIVNNALEGTGINFRVSIIEDESMPEIQFGVISKGTVSRLDTEVAASRTLHSLGEEKGTTNGQSLPICVFLFSMRNDLGYYAWRSEPIVVGNVPQLRQNDTLAWRKLDPEALDQIVNQVKSYSRHFQTLASGS